VFEFLGINAEAENLYLAILKHPDDGVPELARRCAVSEQAIHQGLDELIDLQLVQPSRETQGRLRAVSPKVGLNTLLRRQKLELQRKQEDLAISSAAVQRLISETDDDLVEADIASVERLTGMDAVQLRLEELSHRAERECLSLMPGGAQSPESLDGSRPLDEDALKRGVSIRTVYLDSARKDHKTLAYVQWMVAMGGQVRTAPALSSRLLVLDRKIALLPLDAADSRAGVIQVGEPGIVAALASWFEEIWSSATPVDREIPRDDQNLTSQERELLRLLGQGLTDEMAGRRLGISLRTARRMMADMMGRLGAQSRFEAGLLAAQLGWISHSSASKRPGDVG
jgi:DNA-binding CsgD family transcriptional regulator/sugar-specific transcriptional regulator TrmB